MQFLKPGHSFGRLSMKSSNTVEAPTIRNATSDDAAVIASIHVKSWQSAYADIFPAEYLAGLSIEARTKAWQQLLEDNQHVMLVAEANGNVVAWASGGISRDADGNGSSELHAIYVLPAYWGKQIGLALMRGIDAVLHFAPQTTLWVLRDNHRAIRFYEKFGYVADGKENELERGGVKRWEIRLQKTNDKQAA